MGKAHLSINPEQFKEFAQLPANSPVVMLNLLKFKDMVPENGLTGEECYKEYMKAASPFFAQADAEVLYLGKPKAILIGPLEEELWDKILLVKYKTITSFLGMIKSDGYPAHLRAIALEDSRLIYCQ